MKNTSGQKGCVASCLCEHMQTAENEWKQHRGSAASVMSHWVKGRRQTDLFCEAPCPQKKPQKTPNDHSQHRHDEEAILFADILYPHPHCIQSHGHRHSIVLCPTKNPLTYRPKRIKSKHEKDKRQKQ